MKPPKPEAKKDRRNPGRLQRLVGRIERQIHEIILKRCRHDDRQVSADILEGGMDNGYTQLQWCRRCGAHRFVFGDHCAGEQLRHQEWRRPRPLWV